MSLKSLYVLYPSQLGYALIDCYGLFKIREKDIADYVNNPDKFRKVVCLQAFYQFDSTDQNQVHAFSEGRVTAELRNFLKLNLPKVEPGKKAEFYLGVEDPKLGSNITRVTNFTCICDQFVREFLRGVHLHINDLLEFPKPGNLELDEEDATESVLKKRKLSKGISDSAPLLQRFELPRGCIVEDLKIGKQEGKSASLMDMVSIHYSVKRLDDEKILLDTTTNGDPVKFRLGTGQVIKALDMGICGMYVGGLRRFTVSPKMGYEKKKGVKGTKGVKGPKGAPGRWLVVDVRLVDAEF